VTVHAVRTLDLRWLLADGLVARMRVREDNLPEVFVAAIVDSGWKLLSAERADVLDQETSAALPRTAA